MNFLCPVCRNRLVVRAASYICNEGHVFDIAKEGYVNLLVHKGKTPPLAGDSLDMLRSRREFLEAGFYDRLRAAVIDLAAQHSDARRGRLVDIGCGDGYYLGGLMADQRLVGWDFYGLDISKAAIQLASKKYREAQFAVTDVNRFIPLADDSIDVMTNIFAPRNAQEFRRVLRPGGSLIVVIPGDNHLSALRKQLDLLGIEEHKVDKVKAALGSFEFRSVATVCYDLTLNGEAVASLVGMTPNARFITAEQVKKIVGSGSSTVGVEFHLLAFTKVPA